MKYIFNETRNSVEVYDLTTDPKEKNNLFHVVNEDELIDARNRLAAWAQFQDQFIKELLERKE